MSYDPYPSGGGPGGYQPFPGANQLPEQQRGPAPMSVINAVRLMYAGAAMNAISVIVALTQIGALRSTIEKDNPSFSTSQVSAGVHLFVGSVIIGGLIGIGLWIWMAFMNKAGKNWARITGTVFFGIDTIGLVTSFAQAGVTGSRIITVIIWLIGLGAVILLWRKESTAFFKPESQQQW
jgi:hypothetical protein